VAYRKVFKFQTIKNNMKYDLKELKLGIKMEKEHNKSNKETLKIAKDHLKEFPHYYSDLIKAEKKFKK